MRPTAFHHKGGTADPLAAVLCSGPLALANDLEAGAVDDQVDGAIVNPGQPRNLHVLVAAGQRRVVRRREVQPRQAQDGVQEAFCLAEREVEEICVFFDALAGNGRGIEYNAVIIAVGATVETLCH